MKVLIPKIKKNKNDLKSITDFIYEVGILSRTPRSGLWFLGTGNQSVAEHLLRTAYITYCLCYLTPRANRERAILMALVHDLGEARTSDLNYVHQKYGRLAEVQAISDIAESVPFGKEIQKLFLEEQARETLEAKLVKDADNIEWLATMREEEAKGNIKARQWGKITYKRLKTPAGKKVGKLLLKIHPDNWYFNAKDKWFVDRNPKLRSWKKKK
ncbi:hypothetical protein A2W67_03815 [Candidatus Nomurabacteria bacterium RIFCSPLOWO2_02_40_28]|uniref:5'-deoxynucleotidase n=2 Tax=Candidatus Nomuraibacteriota TaxID=1752729 RepID=A0A837HS12_9BACT|nr:MAG: Metal dependent phosphohydrolase [Candidatus Nomurabacteria bacterium GW2011_GWD2_39_12]KKR20864.1 MAG: Metal dependent phosphohydrolase [Candidatus Nomurabacteria bacterium GW2011_GWC2_39_41]KKR36388.1 MAG: Metal dependent phosphohydrolase [Candidatus Nomurabacteria bacterium GW2011_GWE2_40_10]KKR38813.1 MAG: Metal dependent phosphohydrolase [Candidatus Nomurabacteria bacterium GW2011_GWB1_40_11]KKR40011.1 MAG: Metal dependent phosphohydrolase [Parcubacteria group bacterium GW2011_GWC1